jgi:hypothetical protein
VAQERHTKAFVVGTLLGGAAGAAAALWRVPRSGAETRATISSAIEETIFKLLGMDERATSPTTPAPVVPASPSAALAPGEPAPVAVPVIPKEEPATMPATFRGEPIGD